MKKAAIKLMMGVLVVTMAATSCKKDSGAAVDTTNNGTFKVYTEGKVTTVQNLMADTILGINPTSGQPYGSGKYTFFSLETSSIVANSDSATTKWDLAFRSTTILTNNGTSGPGVGGAYVHVGLFNDVASVSTDSTFRIDASTGKAIKTGTGNGWYIYDGATNLITPIPGRVLVIRTASGKYAKVEIQNYYRGGTTPAATASDATKTSEQRYYNFRYTYQANGSTTF